MNWAPGQNWRATVNPWTPQACALCGTAFPPTRRHGRWQRYCSQSCAQRAQAWAKIEQVKAAYGLPDDAALRAWLVEQLNRATVTAVAGRCGVDRQALYQWMARFGIRRVVRYE